MAAVNCTAPQALPLIFPIPLATVKAYRRTGGAVVTIQRNGKPAHRYAVSLRRYKALREWTITRASRHWKTSGAWLRSSVSCLIWEARQ